MAHNRPLTLKVANRNDFLVPGLILSFLVLISALLSPLPLPMTIFAVALIGVAWFLYEFHHSRVTPVKPTLIFFPDGTLKLESNHQNMIEGVFCGQQWCNRQLAILQYISAGKRRSLVLLAARQNADDYRRLLVWLRQDLLLKSEGRV